MKTIFAYCDKCGSWDIDINFNEDRCYFCKNFPLKEIPHQYTDNFRWRDGDGKQAFIEEVVKKSPNLDQYLFEHKDEIIQAQNDDMNAKMAIGRAVLEGRDKGNQFGVECPYCHTTNVKKITNTSKAVHTALFGIFSISRNSKQWHCNSCNSDF